MRLREPPAHAVTRTSAANWLSKRVEETAAAQALLALPCYRGRAIIRVAPNTLWNVDPSRRCCLSNVPSTWTWSPLRRAVDTGTYTNTLPHPAELLSKNVMYLVPPCDVPLLNPAAIPSRVSRWRSKFSGWTEAAQISAPAASAPPIMISNAIDACRMPRISLKAPQQLSPGRRINSPSERMLGLVWCGSKARFPAVANLAPNTPAQ